jgi:hypothetical protein
MQSQNRYYTIVLASDPDESVWYFDDEAKYNEALRHAQEQNQMLVKKVVDSMPDECKVADLDEFKAWATTFAHMRIRDPLSLTPQRDALNDRRAISAGTAIRAFEAETGMDKHPQDYQIVVRDLLCNLMHFCNRGGMSFDDVLHDARAHYRAQTAGH